MDDNRYAPPKAPVGDNPRSSRVRPRSVTWAVTALWAAYAITLMHGISIIGHRLLSWPPEDVAISQISFEVLCAALIYGVARGWYWARLVYGVTLGVRTLNVIQHLPADWLDSHGLVLMNVVSFMCQYLAMYWLFFEPGRRWFLRSRNSK
jgi:hypothetical protein